MKTIQLPSIYEALDLIIKYYPDNYTDEAKAEIETLLEHCLDGHAEDSEKFLSTLFLKALKKYVGNFSIDEHIYLKKYEMPQIQLFNILIKQFPFVKYSQEITNTLITRYLKNTEEAIVIDIGIGQGVQIKNLLQKSKELTNLKCLHIIGIEAIPDALNIAGKSIEDISKDLPFDVKFTGLNALIENFDFSSLKSIIDRIGAKVIVNSSLTLHHIQKLEERNLIIQKIRSLNPEVFFLIEPNVDHYEPNFYRRFHNCYQHFYHVFKVIDQLPIENTDKNGLKLFFGREIEDIIGTGGSERYEKHEPAFRWIEKLKNNDFKVMNCFAEYDGQIVDGVKLHYEKEGYLGFTFNSETVLSIICATS